MKQSQGPDILFIDFETRSKADLPTIGAVNYSLDPSTEVIVMSYYLQIATQKGKPSKVKSIFWPKKFSDLPKEIREHKGLIVAHYIPFELSIFRNVLKANKHFSTVSNYRDTMAMGLRQGLPGGLGNLGIALGFGSKVQSGAGLISRYSKPISSGADKGKFRPISKEDLEEFGRYCEADVELDVKIYNALPKLEEEPEELAIWLADQKMNDEGVRIDIRAHEVLKKAYEKYYAQATIEAEKLAGRNDRDTLILTSNNSFVQFLNGLGAEIANAQAPTLERVLEEKKNSKNAKDKKIVKAIKLRFLLNSTAPKKLYAITNLTTSGRMHWFLQYAGGHTLRWAGRGIQPHNFPKETIPEEEYEKTLKDLRTGKIPLEDSIEVISKMLRGLIIPDRECDFTTGDLSAIEARIVFWLSGCKRGSEEFKEADANPSLPDIYTKFGKSVPTSNPLLQSDKQKRVLGKVGILGAGFGMGPDKNIDYMKTWGIDADLELSKLLIYGYRKRYPEVPNAWRAMEKCWYEAITNGISVWGKLQFNYSSGSLRIYLPSGRYINYPKAEAKKKVGLNGRIEYSISYLSATKGRIHIWGGVIFENVVQATARDIIRNMMLEGIKIGLEPKLTVHDEIIAQTEKGKTKNMYEKFKKIMNTSSDWYSSLPLKAECRIAGRFGK